MHRLDDLINIGEAAKIRGVSIDTLRRWEKKGKISSVDRTEGGHRRFRVADLLKIDNPNLRYTVCYGRVSSREKKDDLTRQMAVLEAYCPNLGWDNIYTLTDIGSGLNYKKKRFIKTN
jgi:excisionase family DNA binding protein